MTEQAQNTGPVYSFLMGASDSRNAMFAGTDRSGEVVFSWEGNTDFRNHANVPLKNSLLVPILWFEKKTWNLRKPDLLVNCIADADIMTKSLEKACALVEETLRLWPEVPVFNDPRKIEGTRRDLIYQKFHHLPGIVMPTTIRFEPKSSADVLAAVAREGFSYPVIVRPCGTHQGRSMLRLNSQADAGLLEQLAFDGQPFYLTQYVDYKNADGLYVKTRFLMLDGKLYPRHSISSLQWKIHAATRKDLLNNSKAEQERERLALASFTQNIAPATLASVHKIYESVGLDYLGFDCCLLPDGRLQFFEINPAQDGMQKSDYAIFPYLEPYVAALVEGYNALLTAG